jgi:hypothetical protein
MPGVRPVGIGETLERLGAKCVLLVCGDEAKEACGVDQLCAGLEAASEPRPRLVESFLDS